jgi:hypothetical protein
MASVNQKKDLSSAKDPCDMVHNATHPYGKGDVVHDAVHPFVKLWSSCGKGTAKRKMCHLRMSRVMLSMKLSIPL